MPFNWVDLPIKLKENEIMRKIFVVTLLLVVVLSGCNTMRGLGQDIERGGQAIEKAASK